MTTKTKTKTTTRRRPGPAAERGRRIMVATRLPEGLVKRYDAEAKRIGLTRGALMLEALDAHAARRFKS